MSFPPKSRTFAIPGTDKVRIRISQDADGSLRARLAIDDDFYTLLHIRWHKEHIAALGFPVEPPSTTDEDGGTLEAVEEGS